MKDPLEPDWLDQLGPDEIAELEARWDWDQQQFERDDPNWIERLAEREAPGPPELEKD